MFGHVGLTWGGALLAVEVSRRLTPSGLRSGRTVNQAADVAHAPPLAGVDYRFVVIGSMLPDLIDKPLGVYILADDLGNGRIFAHGLAFLLLLLLSAFVLRGKVGTALNVIAIGTAAHLMLDRMWRDTHALLWPLMGWRPARHDVGGWLDQMLEQLFSDPYTYVSEILGALAVAAMLALVLIGGGFHAFVRSGRMSPGLTGQVQPPLPTGEERPQEV